MKSSNKINVIHRVVFVLVVDDRVLECGTAFNTNTGRPELWLFECLTKTMINN